LVGEIRGGVLEKRGLGEKFGQGGGGVKGGGGWRKPHNEELNDLYCSPNIIRVIKS